MDVDDAFHLAGDFYLHVRFRCFVLGIVLVGEADDDAG